MFTKYVLIFVIIVLYVHYFEAKSTLKSEEQSHNQIRCFTPDKPEDMPHDVYEKYKISSKHLSEKDKKAFWDTFVNWWKNIFAQIGNFFEKVGNFFKNLFSNEKHKQRESTTIPPTTEPPPTPSPELRKDKNVLICVEYEGDYKDNLTTTKIYEVDVTTLNTDIEKLVTTIKTTQDLMTTLESEKVEITTLQESSVGPDSTTSDPNNNKEKGPVIDGVENKVNKDKKNEATIVRAV